MGKICLVYVLFGVSPRIWNGLRTYTEVPLYFPSVKEKEYISLVPRLSTAALYHLQAPLPQRHGEILTLGYEIRLTF
jgi:hypothetical protein